MKTRYELKNLRLAEKPDVVAFIMNHIVHDADARPLQTRYVWAAYQTWRVSKGLSKSFFTYRGFAKALPYPRVSVFSAAEKHHKAIPCKRLIG